MKKTSLTSSPTRLGDKLHPLKTQKSPTIGSSVDSPIGSSVAPSAGMTLLEMMASLGLFTLMFIFVVQIVKQNQRQTKKIQQGIQTKSSLSSVLSLIRRDLYQASFHLDLNANLQAHFPMKRDDENNRPPGDQIGDQIGDQARPEEQNTDPSTSTAKPTSSSGPKNQSPVFLSSHFAFEGEANSMSFVTYSFSNKALDTASPQWIRVRYVAEPCEETTSAKLCWIRFSDRYWHPELFSHEEPEEKLVLFRDLDHLRFFYTLSESTSRPEWRDSWRVEDILTLSRGGGRKTGQKGLQFPSMVKVELRREEEGEDQSFFFSFSPSYLKAWSPLARSYAGFPKWKAAKKKPKEGSSSEQEATDTDQDSRP